MDDDVDIYYTIPYNFIIKKAYVFYCDCHCKQFCSIAQKFKKQGSSKTLSNWPMKWDWKC